MVYGNYNMIEGRKPRILINVPVYNSVEALPFIKFLVFSQATGKAEAAGKYSVRWNIGGPGVRLNLARNAAAEIAINNEADYLFMVDDDMLLPENILEQLLALDLPIVAPIFFRSGVPFDPLVYDISPGGTYPVSMINYPLDQVFEAPGGVGGGVILIKTEVLKAMDRPHWYYPIDPARGTDLEFCENARLAGFPSFCDSRILVQQMAASQPIGQEQWEARRRRG
jgi:hypothetical protein